MARGNRWKNFGDAFNATYGAVTTIGRDIETLKVNRDYPLKDAEGNDLTGAGLMAAQRARYNALANIEDKYGTAANALAIRQGMEQYAQADDQTRFLGDTYNSRVALEQGKVGLQRAQTAQASSAAGLNAARTTAQNLTNKETAAILESKIAAGIASNEEQAALSRLQTRIAENPAYGDAKLDASIAAEMSKAATGYAEANRQNALGPTYATPEYRNSVMSGYESTTAANDLSTYNNQQGLRRAQMPEVVTAGDKQAIVDAQAGLVGSQNTLLGAEAANRLASDKTYQQNEFQRKLSQSAADANAAGSNEIQSGRQYKIDTAIRDFMANTPDAGSPESMDKLVETIAQIDPLYAQQMRATYTNAELSQITEESKLHREQGMQALQERGVEGLMEYLDEQDGKLDGSVKFVPQGDNGGGSMVLYNPDGQPVQVLFRGDNAEAFRYAADRYMQPSNMWAFAEQMYKTRGSGSSTDPAGALASDPLALAMGLNDTYGRLGGPLPGVEQATSKLGPDAPQVDPSAGLGANANLPAPLPIDATAPGDPAKSAQPDAFQARVNLAFSPAENFTLSERIALIQQDARGLAAHKLYNPNILAGKLQDAEATYLVLADGKYGDINAAIRGQEYGEDGAVMQEILRDPNNMALIINDLVRLNDQEAARASRELGGLSPSDPRVIEFSRAAQNRAAVIRQLGSLIQASRTAQ